jgi:hypothetical protein
MENNLFTIPYICRCEACLCSVLGSLGAACDPASGQCSCRPGYTGHKCNICPDGGGERHGGCGQGPSGFIHRFSYAKLFAIKMYMSFTLCLSSHVPYYTVKRLSIFPSPSGKSQPNSPWTEIIKFFLSVESLVSDFPAGDGEINNLFYSVP